MTTTVIYGDDIDGYLYHAPSSWATSQAGTGTISSNISSTNLYSGVYGVSGIYEGFLAFDTSGIPDGDDITGVILGLCVGTFGFNVVAHNDYFFLFDWGPDLQIADFRNAAALQSLNSSGKYVGYLYSPTSGTVNAYVTTALNGAAEDGINKTGYTYLVAASDNYYNDSPPASNSLTGYLSANNTGTTKDPYLSITHELVNSAPTVVNQYATYASGRSAAGPNTTWGFTFRAQDSDVADQGANALSYELRTGANGTGTLIHSGTCTHNVDKVVTGLSHTLLPSEDDNILFVRVSDGKDWSISWSFTVYKDTTSPVATSISYNPIPVGPNKQYQVNFTIVDPDSSTVALEIRTGPNGTGALLVSYPSVTVGSPQGTGTITDNSPPNKIGNSTFESSITSWVKRWGPEILARDTTKSHSGTASMKITPSDVGHGTYYSFVPVAGHTYQFSMYTWVPANCTVRLYAWDSAAGFTLLDSNLGTEAWKELKGQYTIPSGATEARIYTFIESTTLDSWWIDDVEVYDLADSLQNGTNTRYFRMTDKAGNVTETPFDVGAQLISYVQKSFTFKWDQSVKVSKSFTLSWNQLVGVNKSFTFAWVQGGGVTVTHTFAWNQAAYVSNSWTFIWEYRTGVEKNFTFAWAQYANVAKEFTLAWDQSTNVSTEFTFIWTISQIPVTLNRTFVWKIASYPNYLASVLNGSRGAIRFAYRFEKVDGLGNFLGDVSDAFVDESVVIDLNNDRAIRRVASFTIEASKADINPLTDRVRIITDVVSNGELVGSVPMGIYRYNFPHESFSPSREIWTMDAMDISIILQLRRFRDGYVLPAGSNYIDAARAIVTGAGLQSAFPPSSLTNASEISLPPGTTELQALNLLLSGAGMYAAYANTYGYISSRPIQNISNRVPDARYYSGKFGMLAGSTIERELSDDSIINVVIAISEQQDGSVLSATAVNDSPNSPVSTVNLGYERSELITYNEISDQAVLEAKAKDTLIRRASVYRKMSIETKPDPARDVFELYEINEPETTLWYCRNWKYSLALARTMVHEVSQYVEL